MLAKLHSACFMCGRLGANTIVESHATDHFSMCTDWELFMGDGHRRLPADKPLTEKFTVHTQPCGPKAV